MTGSVTLGRLGTGLNNQRLCLLGLFEIARARDARVTLPETLENFSPALPRRRGEREIPLWDLFDRDRFLAAVADRPVVEDRDAEVIDMHEAFRAGAAASRGAASDNFAGRFLLGTAAAPAIAAVAGQVLDWLAARGCRGALQLRVERDWRAYYRKRGLPEDDRTLEVDWIVARARALLPEAEAIWVCCDEADLPAPVPEVRARGARHGLDLLFKPQLPPEIGLPVESPRRAMTDFTICRQIPDYLGVTRSSFSQLVATMNRLEGSPRRTRFIDADAAAS